ncbi:ABC transporter permease [Brevibacterium casei]|uniref:ABC-type dipeptide/oligopeptide/nickel transporter permease n=1 Tax=Brevibacterium casei S18 TaxID=1229781 RepID=K9B0Q3_9MICO|nr:ABC transporter permease [Brevibacterium casei]EKU47360.1 ABC-type dipeptide/oligopeptide/nickel transporter permease [Brevibacterium casei S18]MBE4694059.1 ABC transporter permease [Brevibacterium casei]MBY3577182.1 ABC transporter permease [Brevibacterium casei]MCT1765149.1 ABC transporter permease [Brevibacterium casei]MCT2359527.1 ABC transporter permease [Brevibacterium casei]
MMIDLRYVLLRLGQAVLVLLLAFTAAFILLSVIPGDGVTARFADPALGLSADQVAAIRAETGADEPLLARYLITLGGFLAGDFGFSVQTGAAVSTIVAAALPSTIALAVSGFLTAVVLAVLIAVFATYGPATGPQAWVRRVLDSVPSLFISIPVFWLGILLIQVFSFQLGIVSVVSPTPAEALVLPTLTVAVPLSAPIAQVLIRSITEVKAAGFVKVTAAKGASERWILIHTVARNALLPGLTIVGLVFGELVAGAVVTETVFGRNGIGQITAQAVTNRDNPILLAVVVLATLGYVVINLAVDLLYPVIDVRLRGKPGTASARAGRGSGRGGARSSTAHSAVTATDPTTKEALAASASSVGVALNWAERSAVGPADSSAAGGPATSAQDAAEPGRALNGKRTP